MRLLILGGTHFVGRHVAAAALARGHAVTLFNRGRSDPELFPQAERIVGDRDGDLSGLARGEWDAVLDPSAFFPDTVERTAALLSGRVGLYGFVSSAAAYSLADERRPIDESAPLRLPTAGVDLGPHGDYGALKAACERTVAAAFAGTALTIRPGLIVGPHDLTDRLTYWVRRIADGGDVLAPGPRDRPIQLLDARDLAEWWLNMAERGSGGVYNLCGPRLPLHELFARCARIAGRDARIVWADEDLLLDAGVKPWTELPLWMPAPDAARVSELSSAKAAAHGLALRSIDVTIGDVLAWDRSRPRPRPGASVGTRYVVAGLAPDREAELLTRLSG
jgi:2'-hydroxyisoflavone reductase